MPRLPTPGSDDGTWGNILNDFLQQSHNNDGTLKDGVVDSSSLDSSVQTSLAKADSSVQSVNSKTGSAVTLAASDLTDMQLASPANGQILSYSSTAGKWTNSDASYQPIWKANTAYTNGQLVVNPSGLIARANSSHTSGASYSSSSWTVITPRAITLNVKDFGAVGDGVTADDAAFLTCLTAAKNALRTIPQSLQSDKAGSIVIEIPAGDYILTTSGALLGAESMTQKGVGIVIKGVGKGISNIIYTPASGMSLCTNDYWQSVFFRDLGFYTAIAGCTFFNVSTTHSAQRFQFDSCEFVGFQYVAHLTGNNNNSEWMFINCHSKNIPATGAFLYIPSAGASDQFLNFWFYGCTHWQTDAPFIDAALGGSFHIFGLDASAWGNTLTTAAGTSTAPGKLFYLRGTSHAQGVCMFEAQGVRMEIKNALGGLLYSEWPQGIVSLRNIDVSSQTPTYNYGEMIFINYVNVDGAIYTFDESILAGYIRVGWAISDWSRSHRITVRNTTWLQKQRPDLAVVYDTTAAGGNVINRPFVEFINCRPAATWTNARINAATWDATVSIGYGGELVYPTRKRELRVSDVYGGPTTAILYPALPIYAFITDFEVMIPAGTTGDATTGTWTLQTNDGTPVVLATVSSPGALSAGCRVSASLSPPYRLTGQMNLQVVTSGVTSNNPATMILIKGYW